MPELILYVKPSCHLCTDAAALLGRLQPEYGFRVREVDIMSDPDLHRRYGDLIPVVEHAGQMVLHAPFGAEMARRRLTEVLGGAA